MNLRIRTGAVLGFAFAGVSAAFGQVNNFTFFRINDYVQSGAGTTVFSDSHYAADVNYQNAGDYSSATLTLPDGVTQYPFLQNGVDFFYNSPGYASSSELETNYPHGTYTYDLVGNGQSSASLTIEDAQDRWPTEVPTVAEYDALQTATAGQAFTLHVAGFTPGDGADDSLSFFRLHDNDANTDLINDRSSDNGAYTIGIGAGALQAGHSYSLFLTYSSRLDGKDPSGIATFNGYDQTTEVAFSVAPVPEPASMVALGLGTLAVLRRRKKA